MKKSIILMGALFICTILFGDDGSMDYHPVTGHVFFSKSMVIDMVWEKVTYQDNRFTTVFCFSNLTKQEQKVKMGFPIKSYAQENSFGDIPETGKEFDKQTLETVKKELRFQSYINGKDFPRTLYQISGDDQDKPDLAGYDYLYLGETVFAPGEVKMVSNTYFQKPNSFEDGTGFERNEVYYVLKSGSTWKNPIKKAEISMTIPLEPNPLDPSKPLYAKCAGYGFAITLGYINVSLTPKKLYPKGTSYQIEWSFDDLTPKEDVSVKWGYKSAEINGTSAEIFPALEKLVKADNADVFAKEFDQLMIRFNVEDVFYSYIYVLGTAILNHTDWFTGEGYDVSGAIRFVINGVNAVNGYKFQKPLWKDFFGRLKWYNGTTDSPQFSAEETKFIDGLTALEAKLKK